MTSFTQLARRIKFRFNKIKHQDINDKKTSFIPFDHHDLTDNKINFNFMSNCPKIILIFFNYDNITKKKEKFLRKTTHVDKKTNQNDVKMIKEEFYHMI